jgi:hypothetical protein
MCTIPSVSNVQYGPNWSGTEDVGANTYYDIYSDIELPHTTTSCSNSGISLWVGLGGDGPPGTHQPQLLQNGVMDVDASANNWSYFWEALNGSEDTHPQVPSGGGSISPDDKIQVHTSYDRANGKVSFFWYNYTTGRSTSIVDKATILGEPASNFWGNLSAEAIAERPFYYPTDSYLSLRKWDSGDIHFLNSYVSSATVYDTKIRDRPHENLNMTSTGTSTGTPIADWVTDTGLGEFFVHHDAACG